MDSIKDYALIWFALCLVLLFGGFKIYAINENEENYNRAIVLEDKYDIYYDGEKLTEEKKENFSIAALGDHSKINVEIDDSKMEIYINKKLRRNRSIFPMPIFMR